MANSNIPSSWYNYPWPLEDNPDAPKPSNANYDPSNVAWLIEWFGSFISSPTLLYQYTDLRFRYENNTPDDPTDDIYVQHPQDKVYIYEKLDEAYEKSDELALYEFYAKKSAVLKNFEKNSPAEIEYFKD